MFSNIDLRPRVIRASAGSGKTFQLSSRFLQLVLMGESPDKILATTFTRKAAGEIRDRIIHRLVSGGESEQSARALGASVGIPSLTLTQVRSALRRCIDVQHRLLICTLDSFFSSIAKSFSQELELPANWRLMDPLEMGELQSEAVREMCSNTDAVLALLSGVHNAEGKRGIHATIVDKVKKLQELYYATPKEVWSYPGTFSSPGDAAVKDSLVALADYEIPKTKAGSPRKIYVDAVAKIQRIVSSGGGWEESLLCDGGVLIGCLMRGGGSFGGIPVPDDLIAITQPIVSHVKSFILTRLNSGTVALRNLLESVIHHYEIQRNAASVVSFDDVKRLIYSAAVVKNLSEVFFRIDTRISHVLLDEFQDTSLDEWRIVEPIAEEIMAHGDETHSFFCVGDTKQSIYGFRGGVAEIFDTLESRWSQIITERFEVSRRSSQVVLDFINTLFIGIDTNPVLLQKLPAAGQAWRKRFDAHTAFNRESPGYVRFTHVPKKTEGEDQHYGMAISHAADEIKRLHLANPNLSIGVLTRTQATAAPCLYELSRRGIEASGEGGSAITDSPVVSVLLSFLWLVDHPGDTISHYHVARSPLAHVLGVHEDDTIETRDGVGRAFREQLLELGLREALSTLAQKVDPFCSDRDRSKVLHLVEASISGTAAASPRLTTFVEYVRKLKVPDPEQSNVRVMTIHKAKGLEFDAVFLCDLDQEFPRKIREPVSVYKPDPVGAPTQVTVSLKQNLRIVDPGIARSYEQHETAQGVDALSVLYVALTRARHALYIYADATTSRGGLGKVVASGILSGEEAERFGVIKTGKTRKKKDDEGSSEDEAESMVITAEEDSSSTQVLFENGEPQWHEEVAQGERAESRVERVSFNISFAEKQSAGVRDLKRITPSSHAEKVLFPIVSERAQAARDRGRLLHRLFESVEWLTGDTPGSDRLCTELITWGVQNRLTDEGIIRGVVETFLSVLKSDAAKTLLGKDSYRTWRVPTVEVARERNFAVIMKEGLSVGTIDRLILGIDPEGMVVRAEIIDFKSDLYPSKHLSLHRDQMKYYRDAVSTMYHLSDDCVSAKLFYIESGEVFEG